MSSYFNQTIPRRQSAKSWRCACATLLAATLVTLNACSGSESPSLVPSDAPTAAGAVSPATVTPSSAAAPPVAVSLKAETEDLEKRGLLPKLDRSASIAGPDENGNGVRDDIEAYILKLPLTPVQQRAALQKAKALQMTLTVELTDRVALQKVGDALMASTKCAAESYPDSASYFSGKFESMTANTHARARRYMEYNAARGGSSTSWPDGDTCEK
ncbi:MAG: hypothetical protein ABI135_07055 [Rhodoferax sp.]